MNLEQLSLKALKQVIEAHRCDFLNLNKTYELIDPDNGKNIIDPRHLDPHCISKLFEKLYQDSEPFVSDDVEVDSAIFIQRLKLLTIYLKKLGQNDYPASRLLGLLKGLEGSMKIDGLTLKIFDDCRMAIYGKALFREDVLTLLRHFCMQKTLVKEQVLNALDTIESDLKGLSGCVCKFCKKTFTATVKQMKHCSQSCRRKAKYRRNKLAEKKLPGKYKPAK